MCIRDSALWVRWEILLHHAIVTGTEIVLGLIAGVALGAGTCLLYTSDAADERSSGDLGGRRII